MASVSSKQVADAVIVTCAVDLAADDEPVCIISNDTYIIVLLIYHFNESMTDIFACQKV